MAVQWNLASDGFDALQSLQTFGQASQEAAQRLQQQRQLAEQQRALAARRAVGTQIANGDVAGARQDALTNGDFDLVNTVNGFEDHHRTELQQRAELIGGIAAGLRGRPQAERQAAFTAIAPQLAERGFTPEQLAQVDLTDAGLDGYIGFATQAKDAISAYNRGREPVSVADGAALVRPGSGEVVFQNARDPKWQFDAESGSWIREPGTGDGQSVVPQPGYAPTGGRPASGAETEAGRTQFGWTPRARNGGDNSDAAVDGKIAGMSRALGVNPDAPFPANITPEQIARALTISEGGRGSLADRNNNPGNLRVPGSSAYQQFGSASDGLAAATRQVRRNLARGQNSIRAMVEGLPVGGRPAPSGQAGNPLVVNVRPPKAHPEQGSYRLLSPDEVRAQGLDPAVRYQVSPRGEVTAVAGQRSAQLRPIPPAGVKAIQENNGTIRQIDSAIAALQRRPQSIGPTTGMLGDTVTQFNDPDGTDTRAAIGKISGQIIHDVSGAAVTLSEAPRFRPYVPSVQDRPEIAITKLRRLRDLALGNQEDLNGYYSQDQGYRPYSQPQRQGQPQRKPAQAGSHPADIQAILQRYGHR